MVSLSCSYLNLHRSKSEWSIETHNLSSLSQFTLYYLQPRHFCPRLSPGPLISMQENCYGNSSKTCWLHTDFYDKKEQFRLQQKSISIHKHTIVMTRDITGSKSQKKKINKSIETCEWWLCTSYETENADNQIYGIQLHENTKPFTSTHLEGKYQKRSSNRYLAYMCLHDKQKI